MTLRDALQIYISACKVGALTFGGGYAMLPILQREVVESRGWNTEEEIMDYYALSQCLPGIIMVNTFSFIGEKRGGKPGAILGALGAITPSIIIISIIAGLLSHFADVAIVQNAFAGIRVCVTVLIFNAVLKLWKSSVVDKFTTAIFIAVAGCSLLLDISPVVFVIIGGLLGMGIHLLGRKKVDK